MRTLPLALLILSLAVPALAAPTHAAPGPAQAKAPSPAKREKIRQLLMLTRRDEAARNALQLLKSRIPPAQFERVERLIRPEDLIERTIAIYDRHFTEDEIDGLIDFYSSPLGQRLIEESPAITNETTEVAIRYAMEKLSRANMAPPRTPPPSDVPTK